MLGLPAVMHQAAAEGGLAGHVARHAVALGIEAPRKLDLRSFRLRQQRLDIEQPLEHLAAIAMDLPGDGPHLGVGEGIQGLFDEVHEAGLALQRGQQVQGVVAARFGGAAGLGLATPVASAGPAAAGAASNPATRWATSPLKSTRKRCGTPETIA